MKLYLLSLGLLIFFTACNRPAPSTEATAPDRNPQPTAQTTTESTSTWPAPNHYVSGLPVYETYSDIAPLFQQDNDTTYVVNFWATWCKPCVAELPYFQQLAADHENDPVRLILISLDFPMQVESRLVPFVQERELEQEVVVLLDGKYNDWIDLVSTEWTGAIPATLFYKGTQRHFLGTSVHSTAELEEILTEFL